MTTTEWPRTIWSEARQVNALIGWREMREDHLSPADFFRTLRDAGRDREATLFLAQALPRYEAVEWAARVIDRVPEARPSAPHDTMNAVIAWLADPSDANRRAAGKHAGPVDPPAATTLCALAAFHAGGSIAPSEQPMVPPPRGSTGRFAGAAVIAATSLAFDAARQLESALEEGELVARAKMENVR